MSDYEDMGERELRDAISDIEIEEEDLSGEEDVEAALRRQDEALMLLERLRDFRRWPAPKGVTVEMHDGSAWQPVSTSDLGIGGVRLSAVPAWLDGPVPVRLRGVSGPAVLPLGDLMWRDAGTGAAGLRFEFSDPEEHDLWTAILIDALLARYALDRQS